jgi:hypothetical protein
VEMWRARLSKHADHDPEKPADFRHALLYPGRLLVRTVQPGAGTSTRIYVGPHGARNRAPSSFLWR